MMKVFRFALASALSLALLVTVASIALKRPDRQPRPFVFPTSLALGEGYSLQGKPLLLADFHEAGKPEAFRYLCRTSIGDEVAGLRLDVFYCESGNAEGRNLFRKFTRPSGQKQDSSPPTPSSDARHIWLESKTAQGLVLGSRIDPQGQTTATRAELWRARLHGWRREPARILRWLFTSDQLVDRRALWIEMTVTQNAAAPVDKIWSDILDVFAGQAVDSFRDRH